MSTTPQETAAGRPRRTSRTLAITASVAAHAGLALVLYSTYAGPPKQPEPPPVTVELFDNLPMVPKPDNTPPAAPKPDPIPDPPPKKSAVRPTKAPPRVTTIAAADEPDEETINSDLEESELGGALTAGAGPSGRGCDMVRALQNALRKDRLVQAAVAEAHKGKAMLVWNGDWVKSRGQEGKGLAAVRQAITWEIAFSPEACRTEPVRGLVLISLNDGPGAARLALGGGQWRWSDMVDRRR